MMHTPSLLTPDAELSPAEWLRRFALTRFKYGGEEKARLLELANLLQETEMVRDLLGQQLERIANTVKGAPEPGGVWGFDDLPELIQKLMIDAGRAPGAAVADNEALH